MIKAPISTLNSTLSGTNQAQENNNAPFVFGAFPTNADPVKTTKQKPANSDSFDYAQKLRNKYNAARQEKVQSLVVKNPELLDVSDIDVENPHGTLGILALKQASQCIRDLPMSYPLYGLQLLASSAASGEREYKVNGVSGKISLLTILLSPSSGGKGNANGYLKKYINEVADPAVGAPRSDKDIFKSILENEGKITYVIDEAQSLFKAVFSDNSSVYLKTMIDLILDATTTEFLTIPRLIADEVLANYSNELSRTEKQIAAKIETGQASHEEITMLKLREEKLNRIIEVAESRLVTKPSFNMAMCSTPSELEKYVNESTIGSGFIGRSIIVRTSDVKDIALLWRPEECEELNRLHDQAIAVMKKESVQKKGEPILFTKEAESLISDINAYYETNSEYREGVLHPAYGRALERVIQVSALMGMTNSSGKAELKDVRYALALVKHSIENIKAMINQSIVENGAGDAGDVFDFVKNRILSNLKAKGGAGLKQGDLKSRVNRHKKITEHNKQSAKANQLSAFDMLIMQMMGSEITKVGQYLVLSEFADGFPNK